MSAADHLLAKLRRTSLRERVGDLDHHTGVRALDEFEQSGVNFVASHGQLEQVYYHAVHDLLNCIVPAPDSRPMLLEGSVFIGCWLESTGTISTETLSRFCPEVARGIFELFPDYQRDDGLFPYKIIDSGPSYRQIQMVTPLARSVWNHYQLHGDKVFLAKLYAGLVRMDRWLETYRDTLGTGCVEAFCTFDVGQDASPRFWGVTDTPFMGDPTRYDPDSPVLPYLAPDLTANVYCQRLYMARMADALGEDGTVWRDKAARSLQALMTHCWDERDHYFYDRDRHGRFVRVEADTLLRVLACEVGDDAMFADALRRYLLNTRKYFSRYPLVNMAIDDPRFYQNFNYNSWSGHVSFLTELRLTHAFECHRRATELTMILQPVISAAARMERFSGSINPWIGCESYSGNYTPTMLTVLDYLERLCGIFPTPEGEVRFTALIPRGIDYGQTVADATGYSRRTGDWLFELINTEEGAAIYRNGTLVYRFPLGVRLITDRDGELKSLVGVVPRQVTGNIDAGSRVYPFTISGNERLDFTGNGFTSVEQLGVIPFNHGDPDDLVI